MIQLSNFRSYQMASQLYKDCTTLKLPTHVRDQLLRASLSVPLNLAEGSAKLTSKERRRFYNIAFASLREVQALFDLCALKEQAKQADHLAAMVYRLVKAEAMSECPPG